MRGKVDLQPLLILMGTALLISYASRFLFSKIGGFPVVQDIGKFGVAHLPTVSASAKIALMPDECAFIMTIQWVLAIAYALAFVVGYFPLAPSMRVATRRWYKLNPLPDGSNFRYVIFLALGVATILGDLYIIKFPTLLNGMIISIYPESKIINFLINSAVVFPFFSWFIVLGYIFIYWGFILAIVNRKVLFNA